MKQLQRCHLIFKEIKPRDRKQNLDGNGSLALAVQWQCFDPSTEAPIDFLEAVACNNSAFVTTFIVFFSF